MSARPSLTLTRYVSRETDVDPIDVLIGLLSPNLYGGRRFGILHSHLAPKRRGYWHFDKTQCRPPLLHIKRR